MGDKFLSFFNKFITIVVVILPILLTFGPKVTATAQEWSWTSSQPFVFSSTKITGAISSSCNGFIQPTLIDGEAGKKDVCITSYGGIKYGTYFAGSRFMPVIGFALDSKMYKIWGISEPKNGSVYSPNNDMLITKQFLDSNNAKYVVIYKNFLSRLSRVHNLEANSTEYYFNSSNPDYSFHDSASYAWMTNSIGMSDSGNWLAVELKNRGIGLLDLSSMKMKLISTFTYTYGIGYDPTVEFAISNNGKHLAAIGLNAGITVYDIDSDCGKEIAPNKPGGFLSAENSCKSINISTGGFMGDFYYAILPKFNENGGQLSFYANSYRSGKKEVSLRATGYKNIKMDYMALGDSFTSGEGETDDKYYLKGTNDEFEKCHVSLNSYPYVISDLMGIDVANMANVACSGAEIKDVIGNDTSYLGQGRRLGKDSLNFSDSYAAIAKTNALDSFLPGRVHQESFIKEYSPKAITVSIGGNDAGFMKKLTACLSHDTCSWADTEKGKEQAALEIKNMFSKLTKTYQKIYDDSPDSRIFAIGYPKIIDEDNKCNLINGYILDDTERKFMNESVKYLNSVISAAARYVGIKYVDVEDSFGDQTICGSKKPTVMNAIRLGDDISIIKKLPNFKPIGNESFHPKPSGHILTSNTIVKDVENIGLFDYCQNGMIICPDKTISAPEPSKYWIPYSTHNYPALASEEFITDANNASDNRQKNIHLDKGTLRPGSNVKVEIASEPKQIGEYAANDDGSLDIYVKLPSDLEHGYHTVRLYGFSYSDEPVELYDVIPYEQAHESDPIGVNKSSAHDTTTAIGQNNTGTKYASGDIAETTPSEMTEEITPNASLSPNESGQIRGWSDSRNAETTLKTTQDKRQSDPPYTGLTIAFSVLLLAILPITLLLLRNINFRDKHISVID